MLTTLRRCSCHASTSSSEIRSSRRSISTAISNLVLVVDVFQQLTVDHAPIFEKVCSLTEDEDKRYRGAYERLRRMIDSELLEHIDDESKRFCDQLIAVLIDLRDNRISLLDVDAWDEHRRKVRSALISFTAALQIHQEQTISAAKKTFGRNTPQLAAVEKLFKDLRKSSFDYGWLEEMRDALQHGDINAFRWGFGASMHGDPRRTST